MCRRRLRAREIGGSFGGVGLEMAHEMELMKF
jgi:hypothetical protein